MGKTENRNVCGNSGKIVRTMTYRDGTTESIRINPDKIGGYSFQFACPLCGKSIDARQGKDGEFRMTSHIVKSSYLKQFSTTDGNFRTMGKREKKQESVPVSDANVA